MYLRYESRGGESVVVSPIVETGEVDEGDPLSLLVIQELDRGHPGAVGAVSAGGHDARPGGVDLPWEKKWVECWRLY